MCALAQANQASEASLADVGDLDPAGVLLETTEAYMPAWKCAPDRNGCALSAGDSKFAKAIYQ
jgi:hypothetical protein